MAKLRFFCHIIIDFKLNFYFLFLTKFVLLFGYLVVILYQ